MKPLTIVVIGCGHMGSLHASKLSKLPGVDVAAVADIDPARAEALAARVGCRAHTTWRATLDGADAAIVAVSPEQHAEVLHGCIERGVHALVEKPIATRVEDAVALIDLARRRNLVLQVAHVERFNGAFRAIADRVRDPMFIDSERLSAFKERGTEVDVVLDLMIHDIDLALALTRSEVRSVSACGFGVLTPGIDIANAYIEFASGCVANLSASRVSQSPVRKLRVFASSVYISADLTAGQLRCVTRAGRAVEQSEETHDGGDPLALQDQAFVSAIRNEAPVPVTGEDGRRALEVALSVARLVNERLSRFETATP
jgi:predicted dehydrogenase